MEKKTYRNALRSKQMIRTAFIELLKDKPIEQVRVVDIVKKADLSRNTFYAHYQDVYAILEEFQKEMMDELMAALNEAVKNESFERPLILLQKICEHIDANKSTYRILLDTKPTANFIRRLKQLMMDCIIKNIASIAIQDRQGVLLFVEVLASGFIDLIQLYLRNQIDLSAQEIACAVDKIWITGITAYK